MNWKYKIADFCLLIAFWIVLYIDIDFSRKLGLSQILHGRVVFLFSLIGVSAIYICAIAFVHYLMDHFM